MGIFSRLFGKKKSDEQETQPVPPQKSVEEKAEVEVSFSVAYKLVGYNTDSSPWYEKEKEVLDEMVKNSDEYFSRDKAYTNAEIQTGGIALDFNIWKFGKWEQKVVTTKEVDGVVVEKNVED